jgi:hypothetical protein
VTENPEPTPKAQPTRRGIRGFFAANPEVTTICAYAVAALALAVTAYLAIFTLFATYDDEGTLLVTLKAFVNGETLYRDVFAVYGPFYYEVFGGLFSLTGHAVTTDASRSIVVVVWVATSLMYGIAAQRLTGLLTLGISGMIAAFLALGILIAEPMHPHGACTVMLAAFVLLAVAGPGRRPALAGGLCGALIAAIVLTKVNLGVFAFAAVALAAVLTIEPLHRRRWVRWPVLLAFLAMPILIVSRDLREIWVRNLVALEVLAMLALVVAAWPLRPRQREDSSVLSRWVFAAAAGFAAAFVAIVGIILLTGPSLTDVYEGVVTNAFLIRDILSSPFPLPAAGLDWAVAALAAAALATRLGGGDTERPSVLPGLLRVVAGLAIWFSAARMSPFGLNPSAGSPDTLPLLLAWVAAIPPAGVVEAPYRRFVRVLLPTLAVVETLQVYPVAGGQMGIAAVVYIPVGALCLADALTSLRAWGAARGPASSRRLATGVTVAGLGLVGLLGLNHIVLPATSSAIAYRDQKSLPFPGAELMHLPEAQVAEYEGIVHLLRANHCTIFVGYPNLPSMYLWTGYESPPPQIPDSWMKALDDRRQQQVVDEMHASPRPCVYRNEGLASSWLGGAPPPSRPLVDYVLNDFETVAEIGGFEFMLPKGTPPRGVPR